MHREARRARYPLPPLLTEPRLAWTSIRILGSSSLAEIIIAAGRTSPKYLRSTGQHFRKRDRLAPRRTWTRGCCSPYEKGLKLSAARRSAGRSKNSRAASQRSSFEGAIRRPR